MDATFFNGTMKRALKNAENKTTDMAADVLSIPLDYYRNEGLKVKEREQIMLNTPLPLISSAEIAQPNDFMVRDLFGKSVLLVRGGDGVARAFENYCRHRGAMPASGCGNRRLFSCPYHAWTYDSSGQLVNLPGSEGFPECDQKNLGLLELTSQEFGGLLWVNLTPGTELNLHAFLGDKLSEHLSAWGLEKAKHIETREFEVEINWKAAIENFGETYHFQTVHGQSIPSQINIQNTSTHEAFGLHHFMLFSLKTIVELRDVPEDQWDWTKGVIPVYWIYPGTIIVAPPGVTQIIETLPRYDGGREATQIRSTFLTFEDRNDPLGLELTDAVMNASWEAVYDEDRPLLEKLGQAVRNSSQEHLIIGRNEIGVQHIAKTIAGQLGYDLQA